MRPYYLILRLPMRGDLLCHLLSLPRSRTDFVRSLVRSIGSSNLLRLVGFRLQIHVALLLVALCLFAFRSLGWPLPSMRGERLVSPARRRFVFDVYLRVASLVVKEQVKVGSSPKEEIDPSKLNRIGTTAACTSFCLDAPQGLSP